MKRIFSWLLGLQLLSGCASMNYEAHHEKINSNPESMDTTQVFDGDIPFSKSRRILLFNESKLPKGITLKQDQDIKISPSSEYILVDKIYLKVPFLSNPYIHNGTIWFYSYRPEEGWRKPFCHVQVPLHWVTLGLWSLVPLSWPCHVSMLNIYLSDSSDTKRDRHYLLLQGLKAEALRLKGDAVISSFVTPESKSATGYILRKKRK
jgi:hypothetical protein